MRWLLQSIVLVVAVSTVLHASGAVAEEAALAEGQASEEPSAKEDLDSGRFYLKAAFAVGASPSYEFGEGLLCGILFGSACTTGTGMLGFQAIGGYRVTSWIGFDLEVDYLTGGELKLQSTGQKISDSSALAVTANARLYPITPFLPANWRHVQWAIVLGIGGGRYFEDTAISLSQSTFLVRFGTGLDGWITDHWGVYIDGGYNFSTSTDIYGFGYLTAGIAYRF
jgi:hypothetical protein